MFDQLRFEPLSCSPIAIRFGLVCETATWYSWSHGMLVPCTQVPVFPFESERYMPPSSPRYTRFATFGSHAIACWSACGPPEFAQVVPPSVETRRLTSILK